MIYFAEGLHERLDRLTCECVIAYIKSMIAVYEVGWFVEETFKSTCRASSSLCFFACWNVVAIIYFRPRGKMGQGRKERAQKGASCVNFLCAQSHVLNSQAVYLVEPNIKAFL